MTYKQLLSDYGVHNLIPYCKLLGCIEWVQKRTIIINRDNAVCQICHKTGTDSIFTPGKQIIHFYEDYEEIVVFDEFDFPKIVLKKILKKSRNAINLHVHHTYYSFDKTPWDYPNESLTTLCSECHFELHKNNKIPWFNSDNQFKYLTPCPRCNGAGIFPEYSHVQGGKCFQCQGDMYVELIKFF